MKENKEDTDDEEFAPPNPEVADSLLGTVRLEEICESMFSKNEGLTHLVIPEPLQGELDLSFLKRRHIESIQFAEGRQDRKITALHGLPPSLRKLTCTHHRLKEITELPATMEELNVSYNQLSTLDFSQMPHLKIFNGNHNQFYNLGGFPGLLEELYLDHNHLQELDLAGLNHLRVLHCVGNRHPLMLKHVPPERASVLDLRMDDGPLSRLEPSLGDDEDDDSVKKRRSSSTKKIDYADALNQYMAYKTKYEQSARQFRRSQQKGTSKTLVAPTKRKDALARLPPCIHCHAHVGMTFQKKDNVYTAHCGIGKKRNCKFEIELNSGYYLCFEDYLYEEKQNFDKEKERVIQLKMMNLFGYVSDKTSAEAFKKQLETYVELNTHTDILMERYIHIGPRNLNRQDLNERQQRLIGDTKEKIQAIVREYQADPLNRELLRDAMKIYTEELVPQVERLRNMKYAVMEMNDVVNNWGDVVESKLVQMDANLETLEYEIDAPKVITFHV